jgi:hydroxymethylpyrimidine pyrophosphatase-like HAD family hydrolase
MLFPPVKPRLIGFDLDGTLLDQLHGLRPEVAAALQALRRSGIEVAFLTGRRAKSARLGLAGGKYGALYSVAEAAPGSSAPDFGAVPDIALVQYEEHSYCATNGGCLLWEFPEWKAIGRRLMPADLVGPLVELLAPYTVNLYQDVGAEDSGVLQIAREYTPEMALCTERFNYGAHARTDLAGFDHGNVTQLSLPASPELIAELLPRVREHFQGRLTALPVRWPLVGCMALEVFSSEANKGTAMAHFAEQLGIESADTMAVGDDTNDLAMFAFCGFSAAMPQAEEHIAAQASVHLAYDNGAAEPGPLVLARYLQHIAAM